MRGHSLTEYKRLNDAIMDSTKYMMIATDPQGKILVFNKQAEIMMGYNGHEIMGRVIPRKWLKNDEFVKKYKDLKEEFPEAEMNFDLFSKRPARDGVEVSSWTFVRSNGEPFPVRLTVTPIKNDSTEIVGYLGVAEDVTEVFEQRDALGESEEMFRTAMEGASIGMALVRPDGKWLKVNRVLCNLLGYTEEEFLNLDFQVLTHPDDLEADLELVKQTLAGEITSYQMEKRYFHKNGNIIWALLSVSLVRTIDGRPKHFVSQIQDITERKQMDRMKSEFISVVSHELRTPLTSIRGSLGLIEGALSQDVPEKVLNLVSLANRNSERLILLINDILDLDKITAGEMHFDMKQQPLAEIVTHAVEANRDFAKRFNVVFRIENNPEDVEVLGDQLRINQVLTNLLSNAAKFSPQNAEVVITVEKQPHSVRVLVSDKGPGIPHAFRARIFDKFAQADSSATREKGGTGLGLHISKMLMERMGGDIGFFSDVGQGSTFWIEFPLEASHA